MIQFKVKFHFNYEKDKDFKLQKSFYDTVLKLIFLSISENGKINKIKLKELLKKTYSKNIAVGNKRYIVIKMGFVSRKIRIVIDGKNKTVDIFNRGDESAYYSKIKNPAEEIKQAKKVYEGFNRHPVEKIIKMNIPIDSKTAFVKLGFIDNLEYVSDKMIFKKDQKTRKRKERTYIHNFNEHKKRPLLLTTEKRNILVIYDPDNQIEVKPEGII